MTAERRRWRVLVGKFDPTIRADQPERYYVGIEVREGKPGTNGSSRSFSRVAMFWRRNHAERFAWLLRQDGL